MKRFLLLFLLCCCVFRPLAQTKIPFAYYQSMVFVKVRINGKGPFLFLLNTGANRSVIDSFTAAQLKLPQQGSDSVEGTAGKIKAALVLVPALQLGTMTGKNMLVTRRNLKYSFLPSPSYLHGILGTDFLKQYVVLLNFKTRQLQLQKIYKAVPKSMALHFDWEEGIPSFAVVLNDTFATRLRYNSGVSMERGKGVLINIPHECWTQLDKTVHFGAPQKYLTGIGVGGSVYLPLYDIRRMRIGDLQVEDLQMVVQPREGYFKRKDATGFFSNNLLEKYGLAVFDFPHRTLILPGLKSKSKMVTVK